MSDNRALESPEGGDGWFVSSFSNGGAGCVEVKFARPDAILVRDSKDRRDKRPTIDIPANGWMSLLRNVK